MFDLSGSDSPRSRCLFTSTDLSPILDLEQSSTKKKPFSIILNHEFAHTIEILVPKAASTALHHALSNVIGTLQYAKVHMKLSDIVTGDFFNQYIKAGNITMLSSGRRGIDPVYSLSAGVLSLDLDRPTFERLGLPGHPIPHPGRKHIKARYGVELDLRLPAMVRGKPGFDRVVRAFERVLDHAVTWLFCDLNGPLDGSGPIAGMGASVRKAHGEVEELDGIAVPSFARGWGHEDAGEAEEMLEWVGLALHGSPRVRADDRVDPLLSRYRVPTWLGRDDGQRDAQPTVQDLVRVTWRGLNTPQFALGIFKAALKVSKSRWMTINASLFNGESYTILVTENHCLAWEYKDE